MRAGSLCSLDEFITPMTVSQFMERHWQRRPLLMRGGKADRFKSLFNRRQLKELVAHNSMTRRDFRVVKSGEVDERLIFDADGIAGVAAMMAAYADGYTIVANNLQRRNRAIAYLSRSLEIALRQPVGANAYLTPPSSTGLAPHFDDHDVFVLQLEGEKSWRIYGSRVELPLRGGHVDIDAERLGEPDGKYELGPGDLLYIPRGFVHEAVTGQESSLHLTLGLSAYRWKDLLDGVVELATRDARPWREAVTPWRGGAVTGDMPDLSLPARLVDLYLDEARMRMEIQLIGTMQPLDESGLERIDSLGALEMGSRVRHRAGTICCVEQVAGEVRLHFPGNIVLCPSAAAPAIRYIAETSRFRPQDLPGRLDEPSRLGLVRKLVATELLIPLRTS